MNTYSRPVDVQRLCKVLGEYSKNWTVHLSGGEPFLYPGFIQICRELTKEFRIKVNTNLSLNAQVREFSSAINPDKVELIHATLHIEERERLGNLEDFIENVLLLKNRGFKIVVKFVLHPTLIERFQRDCQYFDSRGIRLFPKPFQGVYCGKLYPKAYPDRVKDFFSNNASGSAFYPFCFKGINCSAGKSFMHIDSDGLITRCLDDSIILGDIYDGFKLRDTATPCKSYRCSCFGYDLIEKKPFGKHNTNYTCLYQVLSNVKYTSIKRFLSSVGSFRYKKIRLTRKKEHYECH
jgi:MoaA/NifB/PqqE/SkfB family radical SAM enzyme